MERTTNPRSSVFHPRRFELFALLFALAGLLAASAPCDANQVYKRCGKKWLRQAKNLTPAQLSWLLEERSAELTRDLDGDGTADTLSMTSTPSYRSCDLKNTWSQKENTIRIDYGNGKRKIFHWIGGQLVSAMKLHPSTGRMLVVGIDAGGQPTSRWLEYQRGAEPPPERALAEIRPAADPAAETLRVASLSQR